MRHQNATATNHYLYNGKELNTDLGLDWYDYGFRWYDAELGRFPSVDPIIESFPDLTPYNYASNNPSTLIDLWGLQGFDPNLLGEVLTKYGSTFTKAQDRTMKMENYIDENTKENKSGYIEFGYAIFQHVKTGELHISEVQKGYPEYVVPVYAIDRFKIANPDLFSKVRLIGIYHTHPANRDDFTDEVLIDTAPISPQDFKGIVSTAETYKRGGYAISEGFFLIADDVSGGRYAFVIENLELANQNAPFFKPDFSETKESMKKIILDIRKSADIRSSGGEKARQYYNKRLGGTGISLYYNSNRNSVNLMRIPRKQYFTGKLPTIY